MAASGFILGAEALRRLRGETAPPARPSVRKSPPVRRDPVIHPQDRVGQANVYVVRVADHPDAVKIGMARQWNCRRNEYASWNLRPGNAMTDAAIFRFMGAHKLRRAEAWVHQRCPAPVYARKEWFRMEFEEACHHVVSALAEIGISPERLTDEEARAKAI